MSCPRCFSGTVQPGSATGIETTIHGLPTYVARPEGTPKGLVVIIPDGFGWKLENTRMLCDSMAKEAGYLMYLPEFMNGKAASISTMLSMESLFKPAPSWASAIFQKPVWFLTVAINFPTFLFQCRQSVTWPRITSFFQALRTDPETADLKIGAAGFCWGGRYTVMLCHDDPAFRVRRPSSEQPEPLIDAGYTAHPSGLNAPEDFEKLQIPLSVAVGDVDMAWSIQEIKKAQVVVDKSQDKHELVILPGAKHGFGVRADPEEKDQIECAVKSYHQSVAWFNKQFGV